MARPITDTSQDRPIEPRGYELDAETLRLVQTFLIARVNQQAYEPRLIDVWERFYLACDPMIRRVTSGGTPQIDDRNDRAQEIWRVVIARLGRYDASRGPFRAWLRAVIRHALIDQQRSYQQLLSMDPAIGAEISGADHDPACLCEIEDRREQVHVAMAKLRDRVSDMSYQIVYDRWFAGRSFEDIAASLGLSVKQVRDRHHRALHRLRDLLIRDR
jgi:RNA polymerase sigma factor (sigma-70 family)